LCNYTEHWILNSVFFIHSIYTSDFSPISMSFYIICRLLNNYVRTHCIPTARETFILFLITCSKSFISADHLKVKAFYVSYITVLLLTLISFSIVKLCWKICRYQHVSPSAKSPIPPCYTFYTFSILIFLLDAFAKFWKATVICVMSVCPSAWKNSVPTIRISMKFDIGSIFQKFDIGIFFSKIFKEYPRFIKTWQELFECLYEHLCAIMKIFPRILLRMKNILDKVAEKIKARILCLVTFSRKSCRLWDNVEKYGKTRQATKW
jgi:hypothetical protein